LVSRVCNPYSSLLKGIPRTDKILTRKRGKARHKEILATMQYFFHHLPCGAGYLLPFLTMEILQLKVSTAAHVSSVS
jgi:hypothetical protein